METAIVGLIVLLLAVFAVKSILKDKKNGKSCHCGGDCKNCGGGCH